jgi:hypothetical protein
MTIDAITAFSNDFHDPCSWSCVNEDGGSVVKASRIFRMSSGLRLKIGVANAYPILAESGRAVCHESRVF